MSMDILYKPIQSKILSGTPLYILSSLNILSCTFSQYSALYGCLGYNLANHCNPEAICFKSSEYSKFSLHARNPRESL